MGATRKNWSLDCGSSPKSELLNLYLYFPYPAKSFQQKTMGQEAEIFGTWFFTPKRKQDDGSRPISLKIS